MNRQQPRHREGELLSLRITGYDSEGAGVARLDGQVVFVQGALRGEDCLARIDRARGMAL